MLQVIPFHSLVHLCICTLDNQKTKEQNMFSNTACSITEIFIESLWFHARLTKCC